MAQPRISALNEARWNLKWNAPRKENTRARRRRMRRAGESFIKTVQNSSRATLRPRRKPSSLSTPAPRSISFR